MAKEGSTISGLMDTIATLTSMSMQYGVPLDALVNKFAHVRFEPSGFTKNPEIPVAKSLTDYIFRFLGTRFCASVASPTTRRRTPRTPDDSAAEPGRSKTAVSRGSPARTARRRPGHAGGLHPAAERCADLSDCGSIMIRNGACYKCHNCGATSGCS